MKLIHMLWSGRDRRKRPDAALQEQLAWYTLYPARNVKAVPANPPICDEMPQWLSLDDVDYRGGGKMGRRRG